MDGIVGHTVKLVYGNRTALAMALLFLVAPAAFLVVVMVSVGRPAEAGLAVLLVLPALAFYSRQTCVVVAGRILAFWPPTVLRCDELPGFRVDGAGVSWRLIAEVGDRRVDLMVVPTPPWSDDEEIGARVEAAAERLRSSCQRARAS